MLSKFLIRWALVFKSIFCFAQKGTAEEDIKNSKKKSNELPHSIYPMW